MDNSNIEELNSMKPSNCTAKIELLGKYDPEGETIIRDPYYVKNYLKTIYVKFNLLITSL